MDNLGNIAVKEREYDRSLVDVMKLLWANKWIIIIITLVAALVAYGGCQLLTPEYQASMTLQLGNSGDVAFTNINYAKIYLLSDDMMAELKNRTGVSDLGPANFSLAAVSGTNYMTLVASYSDPQLVVKLLDELAAIYVEKGSEDLVLVAEPILADIVSQEKIIADGKDNIAAYQELLENINRELELSLEKNIYGFMLMDWIYLTEEKILLSDNRLSTQNEKLDGLTTVSIEKPAKFNKQTFPLTYVYVLFATFMGLVAGVLLVLARDYLRARHGQAIE